MGRRDATLFPTSPLTMELDKHGGYRKTTSLMTLSLVYLGEHYPDTFSLHMILKWPGKRIPCNSQEDFKNKAFDAAHIAPTRGQVEEKKYRDDMVAQAIDMLMTKSPIRRLT